MLLATTFRIKYCTAGYLCNEYTAISSMSKHYENNYMNYIIARYNPMLFFSPGPSLLECVLFELIIKVSFCGHGIISTICLSASSRQHAKNDYYLLTLHISQMTIYHEQLTSIVCSPSDYQRNATIKCCFNLYSNYFTFYVPGVDFNEKTKYF